MNDITPQEAQVLLAAGGTLLVDVREPHEFRDGHAPGAQNIPLGDIMMHTQELSGKGAVLTMCRSGGRSSLAATLLGSVGIEARSVSGGIIEWEGAGLPVER